MDTVTLQAALRGRLSFWGCKAMLGLLQCPDRTNQDKGSPSMSYETNPYYNPENVGAAMVAEFEALEPNWSFDTVILLRKLDDGTLWIAHDSGCSCPTPFEDHKFPGSFEPVRSLEDAERFVDSVTYGECLSPRDFYATVREALR